jgi:hypothetical protein
MTQFLKLSENRKALPDKPERPLKTNSGGFTSNPAIQNLLSHCYLNDTAAKLVWELFTDNDIATI